MGGKWVDAWDDNEQKWIKLWVDSWPNPIVKGTATTASPENKPLILGPDGKPAKKNIPRRIGFRNDLGN